jgi:tripartite-type tricarboxylate transporter receptor subunit TctC
MSKAERPQALGQSLQKSFATRRAPVTALADPKIKAQLADLGSDVLALSPADFGEFIADETEKWAKVIKSAGIKPQ